MPKRSPRLLIIDIIDAIKKIEKYTKAIDFNEFSQDDKTVDAVCRNLEIIGEAANRFPSEFTDQHQTIEWRKIVGLRNRIVHGYFGVDKEVIWEIISNYIPNLKKEIKGLKV